MESIKRQTAYKSNIRTLNEGVFVKKEGWESNYLITEYGDFSRVNIISIIVSKEDNGLIIDDGTGKINVRFFDGEDKVRELRVGDIVMIIGRPREYGNEIYITGEIARKIDPRWANYRKKELSMIKKIRDMDAISRQKSQNKVFEEKSSASTLSSKERIFDIIRKLDSGGGAEFDSVIKLSKVAEAEDFITDMLMKGEIFEVRPGYLKPM